MPELPEVETVRRQLEPRLVGRRVTDVDVRDPLLVVPHTPEGFTAALAAAGVAALERRGKYLLARLADGATLALHLRMTGRVHWHPPGADPGGTRFLRATLHLDDGSRVTFADQRRFGRAWIIPAGTDEAAYWRGRVGVEPLGPAFTARRLGTLLDGRRVGVKAALLNQALVAGVGNIYADEALHEAGIHPERPAGSLRPAELRRLHRAVRAALRRGLAEGGASIDSFRDALGDPGSMQDALRVHLREGRRCRRCGDRVVKGRVAQRGTYWCPTCQPRGAPA